MLSVKVEIQRGGSEQSGGTGDGGGQYPRLGEWSPHVAGAQEKGTVPGEESFSLVRAELCSILGGSCTHSFKKFWPM